MWPRRPGCAPGAGFSQPGLHKRHRKKHRQYLAASPTSRSCPRKRATAKVTGFDCGPGNILLDAWCQKNLGRAFDANGAWADTGTVRPELLEKLLADPYFTKEPPKSTGREYFNLAWLEGKLSGEEPADVQATLTELTARTIVDAVRKFAGRTRKSMSAAEAP